MSLRTHSTERLQELRKRSEELEEKVRELQLLNDLAVEAGRAGSTDSLLEVILDRVMKALNAEQGTILTARGTNQSDLKTLMRHDDCSRIRKALQVTSEIAGYALYHRTSILIADLDRDKRFTAQDQERALVRSVVCVPLLFGGELLGALMMVNRKGGGAFLTRDQILLETIAGQVGQLLTNLRLQECASAARAETLVARLEAEKEHEVNEFKSQLFSNITHELMTPLSVVLGSLDLLPERNGPRVREEIRIMRRNLLRLQRLIAQLLDLARLDAGQVRVRAQPTDAVEFVGSVVRSFMPLAERNGVALAFSPLVGALEGTLDRDLTEKILANILSNAFKWTPSGGEILVALEADALPEAGCVVTISDTGCGIPPEQLEQVFVRYHQGTNLRPGFGIGLAFVKQLVELLQGSVAIESEPGSGTTVRVRLPLKSERAGHDAAHECDEGALPRDPLSSTAADTALGLEAVIRPAEPCLLIVEDHADLRRYLCEELQAAYTVLEAQDGSSGMRLAFERIPDIVLCDVMMPGIDGCEVCRRLKADERTSHIPVILLTARSLCDDRIKGLEAGADAYVAKPCDMVELKVRIGNLLESRRALRERYLNAGSPGAETAVSADERFLGRVRRMVAEQLSDAGLDTASLASQLGLSRMQLNRKLHALTGRSTHDFIRHLRLDRAAEMLRAKSGSVTEVAYAVGFNNISHFARAFRQEHGARPSEYATQRVHATASAPGDAKTPERPSPGSPA